MRACPLLVLVAVVSLGCTPPAEPKKPEPSGPKKAAELTPEMQFQQAYAGGVFCQSTSCTVAVTVGAGCNVSAPTLGISTTVSDAVIHWVIQPGASGRVAFVENGVNPKDPAKWQAEFKQPARVSDTEFTWLDKNKLNGAPGRRQYDYNIDLTQDGKPCHKDPTIINDY